MADTKSKIKISSSAIGRRKEAVASVRLIPGSGQITVNGKPVDTYFPGPTAKIKYNQPFILLSVSKYDATVKTHGGGLFGQLDAMVLGLSRALAGLKPEYKQSLSMNHLMTRDSRTRQRRMVGTGGKARRRKQSPKR